MADAEQPLTGNPAHRVPRLVLPELTEDQKKNLDCLKIVTVIISIFSEVGKVQFPFL